MQEFELTQDYTLLTPQQRRQVRLQYIELQHGKCYWCKNDLTEQPPLEITSKPINWNLFPPNFLKYPIHLQHCHYTGMTEGAVHAFCNAYMWQYEGR